jgi:hypothetical protein
MSARILGKLKFTHQEISLYNFTTQPEEGEGLSACLPLSLSLSGETKMSFKRSGEREAIHSPVLIIIINEEQQKRQKTTIFLQHNRGKLTFSYNATRGN